MAISLIGKVKLSSDALPLLTGMLEKDKASSVRCAAAAAIGGIGEPAGVEPLRRAAKTYDVYVQRACGKALCALYKVEGIDLLIKSMSFPSIDAFYNYDRNVPNYVSTFAGFDLPDSERYVQAKWQSWFDTHRDSINIKFSADAYRAWTNLADSLRDIPDTAQVPRYEAFLVRFPGYKRAKTELAGKLNGIAWNLATAPKGSKGSNPKLALKYALRAVELSDDANIWDTVIEAYLANGRKAEALRVCKDALAKHPNEQILKDRLTQLEKR
jgi:tetratricopeptide (TPR) repeat protein